MEVGNLTVKLSVDDVEFRTKLLQAQQLLSAFDAGLMQNFGNFGVLENNDIGTSSIEGMNAQFVLMGTSLGNALMSGVQNSLVGGLVGLQTQLMMGMQSVLQVLLQQSGGFQSVGIGIVDAMQAGVLAKANALTAQVVNAVQTALAAANAALGNASSGVTNSSFSNSSGNSSTINEGVRSDERSNNVSRTVHSQTTVNFDFKDTTLTTDRLRDAIALMYDADATYL